MHKITINVSPAALVVLSKELEANGYSVTNPLRMIQIVMNQEMSPKIIGIWFDELIDGGSNGLIGDVLTDEQAEECGAATSNRDNE